jgi:hypothetical protein
MRYLAARNVTDGSEVTMQTLRYPGATWERLSGRVEPAGSAPQRPARDSVMTSPFPLGTAVTLSSLGAWLSLPDQPHRQQTAGAVRHAVAACAQTAGPFQATPGKRTLFVPEAAMRQAAGIPAFATDRALPG